MTPPPSAATAAAKAKPSARRRAEPAKRRTQASRRVSGPAPPRKAERPVPQLRPRPQLRLPLLPQLRPLPVLGTIGSHAFRAGRSLPDSPFLDRLLRGRLWIGLLAVLLFGLVAVNVSLLKLNAQAGRNGEKVKALRIENDRLRAQVSRLGSGDRLDQVAGRLGLVMPEPSSVRYLSVGPDDALRAARALQGGKRQPTEGPLSSAVSAPTLATALSPLAPTGAATATPASPGAGAGQPSTGAVGQQPAQPQPGAPATGGQTPATTGAANIQQSPAGSQQSPANEATPSPTG
jgi:hypothetical protein